MTQSTEISKTFGPLLWYFEANLSLLWLGLGLVSPNLLALPLSDVGAGGWSFVALPLPVFGAGGWVFVAPLADCAAKHARHLSKKRLTGVCADKSQRHGRANDLKHMFHRAPLTHN